ETCLDQLFPRASIPSKPKTRVSGAVRPRKTTTVLKVLLGWMAAPGKYLESGWATPSIVKPVTIAATPATSRRLSGAGPAAPVASGNAGHTLLGAVTRIAAAPVGTVTRNDTVAPPPL